MSTREHNEEEQVANKRVGRYPKAFMQMVVERLHRCDDVGRLAKELGVHRRLLSTWRDKLEGMDAAQREESPVGNSREAALRKEVRQLKRVLAEKTLEADFFKGALHTVEARRQKSEHPGERASTTTSGECCRGQAA